MADKLHEMLIDSSKRAERDLELKLPLPESTTSADTSLPGTAHPEDD